MNQKLPIGQTRWGAFLPFFRKALIKNSQPFLDCGAFVCYNLKYDCKKEAFGVENKPNKRPCCLGLLAHV